MIIDAFGILSMALEATAHTTPERLFRRTIHLIRATQQGEKIAYHTALRVLLGKNMIIERTFIVIGHSWIGIPAEKMARQFQHVVGTAGLAIDIGSHLCGIKEMLFLAQRTGSEAMMARHRVPEQFGKLSRVGIGSKFVIPGLGNHFRDERIGMFCSKISVAVFQRI